MSVVLKADPEAASNAATNPPIHLGETPDKARQSADQPQGQQILERVSPSKAWTLFVLAWIAVVAAAAGLVVWAALANPA
jgi:hypothetical protein